RKSVDYENSDRSGVEVSRERRCANASLNAGPDSTTPPRLADREATARRGRAKENQRLRNADERGPAHFRFPTAGEIKATQKSLRPLPPPEQTRAQSEMSW